MHYTNLKPPLFLKGIFLTLVFLGSITPTFSCPPSESSLTPSNTQNQWKLNNLSTQCQPHLYTEEYITSTKQHLITITLSPDGLQNNCFRLDTKAFQDLKSLSHVAKKYKPLASINGGFFDPSNQQTVSHITQSNGTYLSPEKNPHLTENETLSPYLPAIFNRSELRQYTCSTSPNIRHTITTHNAPIPQNCQLRFSLGGGPQITPHSTAEQEAFYTKDPKTGKVLRDPVRIHGKLARSAVGITPDGKVILALGRKTPKNPGWSLNDMGKALTQLGATQVMALDGGSSSGISIGSQVIYGTHQSNQKPIIRKLKSFLWVIPSTPQTPEAPTPK